MLDWIQSQGGVEQLEQQAKAKAKLIYDYVDSTEFYINQVDFNFRSFINVVIWLKTPDLLNTFCEEAKLAGLINIKGHAQVGGIRISLYNSIPKEAVNKLLNFMEDFRKKYDRRVK